MKFKKTKKKNFFKSKRKKKTNVIAQIFIIFELSTQKVRNINHLSNETKECKQIQEDIEKNKHKQRNK